MEEIIEVIEYYTPWLISAGLIFLAGIATGIIFYSWFKDEDLQA
jgi:hypothetical protein